MNASSNDPGTAANRKRLWDWIGLGLSIYTALSGIVLWYFIFQDQSGTVEDMMRMSSPVLIACPISDLICFSLFFGPIASWFTALLPLVGWLLLRKGSRLGRILVNVVMVWVLLDSFALFIIGSAGAPQFLIHCLAKVGIPILVFFAETVVAPAKVPEPVGTEG